MSAAHQSEHHRALLALILAGGAARPRRHLLEQHGNPQAALAAQSSSWRNAGCDARQIAAFRRPDPLKTAAALTWLQHHNCHLIGWHDADYPPLLRKITSPPLALFIEGDPCQLWHPAVAVVGSRNPSAGGSTNAHAFASKLAAAGIAVVSGLAAGVDTLAHQAALDRQGITIAVLGTGPDLTYPPSNHTLRSRIANDGVLVSEYLPGTAPRPGHFPARNRIIAGLALGTLVVEAAERSGALITARLASDAGREVFAIPGSIHNPMARGCHQLIRDGATLVQDPAQILNGVAMLATELADALRARLATRPGLPVLVAGTRP
jgi:DNA processing protein